MLKVIEHEMGNELLLLMLTVFGMSVEHQCGEFLYPHPHHDMCLHCRICPHWVVTDEKIFRSHRQPRCGNSTLPDGRKVQCNSLEFDKPTCPALRPAIGQLVCQDNSSVHTSCYLTCPSGYLLTNKVNLTCLPSPHLHWDHQLPVCQDINECLTDLVCHGTDVCVNTDGGAYCDSPLQHKGSDFPLKHAHKVLSVFAIFCICIVFLFGPCLALIFLIQWNKRRNQVQQESRQESQNPPQLVKINLKNAKKSQRCYVMRNKWIAKKGEDVTVTGAAVTSDADFCQIQDLIVIKKETNPPVYTSLPTAPTEIVLHNVSSKHRGWYSWTAHLSNNKTDCGEFHLDVKQTISVSERFLRYSRSNSGETDYEELQQEDDLQIPPREVAGFDSLLKNMKDIKRLCVLFDQDRQQGLVTWHNIATSPLIMYDMQQVHNEEYNLKSKSSSSPTFKMLNILHQQGKTVQDLVEFLQPHLCHTAEAMQILDKYL